MEEEAQSEPRKSSSKPTPLQLRERYHLNIATLAHKAKVGPSIVYFMMVGRPIACQHAKQVLATISAETGQNYTLDNVKVALLPEEEGQAGLTEEAQLSDEDG